MSRDIAALVASMTVEEKAAFTAGADFWTLVANERVGIPPIRVTDGPNGARGSALFGLGGETAVCVPCGSALGATWDPELVERVGVMLGEEALTKACRVLLAPTVNLHRSPLGGRNFECYSEDPLLSGKTAAAFVRGRAVAGRRHHGQALRRQRRRVRAPHHQLGDRRPHAARAHAGAVRARGARGRRARDHDRVQPAQRAALLRAPPAHHRDPARRVGVRGLRAHRLVERGLHRRIVGGRPRPRDAGAGRVLREAARATRSHAGDVPEAELDEHVTHLLQVFDRIGALDDDPDWASTSIDRPEHRALAREAAVAADGAAAQRDPTGQPGGPAARPLERAHARGARPERRTPADDGRRLRQPRAALRDQPARRVPRQARRRRRRALRAGRRHRPHHGAAVRTVRHRVLRRTRPDRGARRAGPLPQRQAPRGRSAARPASTSGDFSFRATATYVPDETGTHTFALVQMGGRGRILLDGEVLLDGVADPPGPGTEFFGFASAEALAAVELEAGQGGRGGGRVRGRARRVLPARHEGRAAPAVARPICSTGPSRPRPTPTR